MFNRWTCNKFLIFTANLQGKYDFHLSEGTDLSGLTQKPTLFPLNQLRPPNWDIWGIFSLNLEFHPK